MVKGVVTASFLNSLKLSLASSVIKFSFFQIPDLLSNEQFWKKIKTIKYSHVTGWDIKTDKFLIKFGKDLTEKKFQNFEDTVNYLFEIGKNPSIIDIRYTDGAAIKYGK